MARYRLNTMMAHCKYYRQKWVKREFHAVWNACLPKEYYLWHWLARLKLLECLEPSASSEHQRLTIFVRLVHQLTMQSPKSWLEMYARVRICTLNCLPRDQYVYNAGVKHFAFERKNTSVWPCDQMSCHIYSKTSMSTTCPGSTWLCCRPFWPAPKKWWPLKGQGWRTGTCLNVGIEQYQTKDPVWSSLMVEQ